MWRIRLDRLAGLGVFVLALLVSAPALGAEEGACCLPDETCEQLTEGECEALSGVFHGIGVLCEDVECALVGACCFLDGSCIVRTEDICLLLGGVSWHPGETCDTFICPVLGACCFTDCAPCEELTRDECEAQDGEYQGEGTPCDSVSCPTFGACCFESAECLETTELQCDALGGVSWHACVDCADAPCETVGACCFFDGSCIDGVTEADCLATPDAVDWREGLSCLDAACEPHGACCFFDGQCDELTQIDCAADGGDYQGNGVRCEGLLCPFVQEASFDFPLSPGEAFFDLELFDDFGGTRQLDEVRIELEASVGINAIVTNLSPDLPALNVTVALIGLITVDMCELHLERFYDADSTVDEIPPGEMHDFGRIEVDIEAEDGTTDPLLLEEFTGQGTIELHVYGESRVNVLANVPVFLELIDFRSTGLVIVTYVYSMTEACPSDINGDGVVNVTDLLAVLDAWGGTDEDADLDGDGVVNISDLLLVLADWGDCP